MTDNNTVEPPRDQHDPNDILEAVRAALKPRALTSERVPPPKPGRRTYEGQVLHRFRIKRMMEMVIKGYSYRAEAAQARASAFESMTLRASFVPSRSAAEVAAECRSGPAFGHIRMPIVLARRRMTSLRHRVSRRSERRRAVGAGTRWGATAQPLYGDGCRGRQEVR